VGVLVSSLTFGGAESLLVDLLDGLNRERFTPHLFFLRSPGPVGEYLIGHGYQSTRDILTRAFDPGGILRLARLLRSHHTNVVLLINHLNSLFYGTLAAKLAGVGAVVNWQHEAYRRYRRHTTTMLGRRLLHLGIDRIVAVARGHARYLNRVEKVPADKIITIYNGVDPGRFRPRLSRAEAKLQLNIPPDDPVVSMVALLRPDKAHDVLLDAAHLVLREVPNTRFLIVGDGPTRQLLVRQATTLGISQHVHFLGVRTDIAVILAATDVGVLSTYPLQETFSVAVLEAMSAGLPVVATDVGFLHEAVIPGETGFLVEIGNPRDLAGRLVLLLHDAELRHSLGERARHLVHDQFTVARMTAAFEDLFQELCPEGSRLLLRQGSFTG
jgi:glycosyltransferase involved in cell wall biosynthesis